MDKNHRTVAQKKQPLPAALYLLQLAATYRITDTRPSSFASPAFAGFAK